MNKKIILLIILISQVFFIAAENNINLNFIIDPGFAYNSGIDDSACNDLDSLFSETFKDTLGSTNYTFIVGKFLKSLPDSLNNDSIFVEKLENLDFVDYITPTDFHYSSSFPSKKLFASNLKDTTKTNYPNRIITIKADSFQVDLISLYSPDFTTTANLDSTISFDYSQKKILKKIFSEISEKSDLIVILTSYPKFVCKRIFPNDKRIRYIINFDSKIYRDFVFRKRIYFKNVRYTKGIGQLHLNFKNKKLHSNWKIIKN